jgi:hypothetical protein
MNKYLLATGLILVTAVCGTAQSNVKKNTKPGSAAPQSVEPAQSRDSEKKNGRGEQKAQPVVVSKFQPTYSYQFTRPGFPYSKILIRHDDRGVGEIIFEKDGSDESITDPILLSEATISKLKQLYLDLNFVSSSEDYQYERDYSHLGNIEITATTAGRTRTAKFNWTTHKLAKELADEYRRIGNEYTWKFEMNIALENQPLQSPSLMDLLTGYVQRQEISDPSHLLPMLRKLASDERMPLMARNRASKLVEKLSKPSK